MIIMVGRTTAGTAMRTTTTPSSPLRPSPSSDASRRSSPGAVAVVVQTDDGDDGAKARATAAAARAKEEEDEAAKKRTRETCESVVAWIRGVAIERGRADEPVRYAKGEGLAHRARLLKFRVRTARVRMQPRRPRRAPGRGTAAGSEGGGEDDNAATNNGGVDGSRRGIRRVNSLVALATRNDRNNNNNAGAAAGSKDGTSSADAALRRGYASDSGSGYGSGVEETSSAISDLLALLEHAPYHHESLEDEKRPGGWTGSGSTMSRTGIIRVGVDHQACVPEGVLDSFKRGKMSDREKIYLGARVWPTTTTTTTTRATKQQKKKQTTTTKRTVDDESNSPRRRSRISSPETCDDTEKEEKKEQEEQQEQDEQPQPVFTNEEIAASRAALVERLRDDGADDSLLGLCAIGAEQGAKGWEDDEIRLFGEHVSRFCDDLFPLRTKIPGKSMRDIVNFYYNVWQTDFKKHGRVDVDGADKPAPREARAKRGPGGATKALAATVSSRGGGGGGGGGASEGQAQKNKDVRTIRSFLEWIRGVAMNPKRALHNVHRAPMTARNKGEMMTRWRSTHNLPGVDEYLNDLSARAEASKFTRAEMKSAREKKKTTTTMTMTTTDDEMDSDKTDSAYDTPQRPKQQKRRASSSNEKAGPAAKRRAPTKETK